MKTNLLHPLAVVVGLSLCVVAQGQTPSYQAPAKWNQFNPDTSPLFRSASTSLLFDEPAQAASRSDDAAEPIPDAQANTLEQLPIPAFIPADRPLLDENGDPLPTPEAAPSADCNDCQGGVRALPITSSIAPWFGGAELLFFNVADNSSDRSLAIGDANGLPYLSTSDVNPAANTGFTAHIGRYLQCGQSALDVSYFSFNPGAVSTIVPAPAPSAWRAAMPAWNNVMIDLGGGPVSVYSLYDGAAAFRAQRNMFFQGIEANFIGFGLMGARRVGSCGSNFCGPYGRSGYFGGAGGPLARACSGRVQVQTSQGFRWFQLEDEFQFAANIDGTPGYQAEDVYYDVETENNLFGYQIGARSTYCLNCRLNLGIGGKIGIYGNHAEYRQRMGTASTTAYVAGTSDFVSTTDSKTFLSALGELDLGLGYRLSNAWTVRGGYRLLAACGVATSVGSIANDYSTLAASARISADDCVILHGGYVGLDYNF